MIFQPAVIDRQRWQSGQPEQLHHLIHIDRLGNAATDCPGLEPPPRAPRRIHSHFTGSVDKKDDVARIEQRGDGLARVQPQRIRAAARDHRSQRLAAADVDSDLGVHAAIHAVDHGASRRLRTDKRAASSIRASSTKDDFTKAITLRPRASCNSSAL